MWHRIGCESAFGSRDYCRVNLNTRKKSCDVFLKYNNNNVKFHMVKDGVKYFLNYNIRFNYAFRKRLQEVIALKKKNYDEILEIRNKVFLDVFRTAYRKSVFYKKLYSRYGISINDIQSISDINKLPIITKEQVRDNINQINIGSNLLKLKGYTSGTTGTPLKVYRDYNAILNEAAFVWAQREAFGYLPGMKTVSLRGDLGRGCTHKYDKFSKTLHLSSYNLSEKNAAFFYNKISDFSPYAIVAYPSSVFTLATYFSRLGRKLNVPFIFTSSETVYDFQRDTVEDVFSGKVVDWYGNAERTIALEQLQNGKYYEIPLYSVNEYNEDNTVTTSLINNSFPLIRYQVKDVIQPVQGIDSFPREIQKISGRTDDILLLPDGTRIGRLDVIFKGVEHIEFAQFIQKNVHYFDLNLVASKSYSKLDENKIINNIKYRIGEIMSYKINIVDKKDIIYTKAGKFKLVINEISNL